MSSIQDQKSCFDEAVKEVAHRDWREFMRKIGTHPNYLDEMYENSDSKYDMLGTWCQKAGSFCENVKKILLGVVEELRSETRDMAVDQCFEEVGIRDLHEARDMAWFSYSFIEGYPDIDAYWRDVVHSPSTFNLNPYPARRIRRNYDDSKEAMYQSVQEFIQKNAIKTVHQAVAKIKELHLIVPQCYQDQSSASSAANRTQRTSRTEGDGSLPASSRGGVNIRAHTISGAVIGCNNVSVNYHYHNSPAQPQAGPKLEDRQKARNTATVVDGPSGAAEPQAGPKPKDRQKVRKSVVDGLSGAAGDRKRQSKPKIMISYAWTQDGEDITHIPRNIASELEKGGFYVWIDKKKMHGDMDRCMKKAVQECDVFIACLSPAYDKSDDCMNEISMAKNFKKKIIPAKVVDFDLKTTDNLYSYITRKKYTAFFKEDFHMNFNELLKEIREVWSEANLT